MLSAALASGLLLTGMLLPAEAAARPQAEVPAAPALATERDRASYMVGMDVGASLRRFGPTLDMAAFERSLRNSIAGGKPLLDEAAMRATTEALMARAAPGQAPGTPLPAVDATNAGLAAGIGVGSSLAPIREELDLEVLLRAVRTVLAGGTPVLGQEDYTQVRAAFEQRVQARAAAAAAELGARNAREGAAFLAANKGKPGVVTTGSGLQYTVLQQGSGLRPSGTDRVRVHYRGTLLDGTEFDSSYARNEPAEFGLDQVIPGWTEAVALMPVGAKYRFWIPGELAYGAKGTPGGPIGPNATLVFEVELLDIL
jgi:FKBP-type peptidyl-prolyl cis-trans isomerase FkpA